MGRPLPGREPRDRRSAPGLGGRGLKPTPTDSAAIPSAAVGPEAFSQAAQVARRSYGRLLAFVAAGERDLAAAEDALAEAFEAALRQWPSQGVPRQPEAWLLAVARRRRVDGVGAAGARGRLADEWGSWGELIGEDAPEPSEAPTGLPERRLELMLACAHPALDASVRAPLILQTLLGWDAASIASAFLVSPSAMAQRLVRAKAKIRHARIPFAIPAAEQWPERIGAVLDAIYAVFGDAWVDAAGADPHRRNLADESIWFAQLVAFLCPQEPEALGLYALVLHTHARRGARRNAQGRYVPLSEQETERWDGALIDEAEHALRRAAALGRMGRYQLEAAIQSAHNVRRQGQAVDWAALELLYGALQSHAPGLAATINLAVAVSRSRGPVQGLSVLDACAAHPMAASHQPYWAARADLLARAERREEAREAYRRAIGLERDGAVRGYLLEKLEAL